MGNFRPSSFTSHKSNSTALRETHLDTAFLAVPLRTIDHFHHHVLPQPQLDPSTGNRKSFSITISGSIPYLFSTPRLERREHPPRRPRQAHRAHKSDSLKKAKTGQGEWKPELGSNSEQNVRGDKHNMTMEQMQKLGQQKANEDKNPGGSDISKGSHQV